MLRCCLRHFNSKSFIKPGKRLVAADSKEGRRPFIGALDNSNGVARFVSDDNVSNIYGTLINKKALCEGYSLAFKYLLDKLEIPNVVVYGKGLKDDGTTEEHSWNYVQMENGNWYAVDCTWDDPIVIGGGTLPTKYKYSFFLKGSSTFFKSHQEENYVSSDSVTKTSTYFTYPTLSTTDY